MRILVCGGRDYVDSLAVNKALDELMAEMGISVIIHGAARGADTLAALWADLRCVPTLAFPADWAMHGKSAGPIRNRRMLVEGLPDGVVAFPGGKGTADMIRAAKAEGLQVWEPIS